MDILLSRCLDKITANEKVLAKCGEFEELEVQEFPNEADAFSD